MSLMGSILGDEKIMLSQSRTASIYKQATGREISIRVGDMMTWNQLEHLVPGDAKYAQSRAYASAEFP